MIVLPILNMIVDQAIALPPQQILATLFAAGCLGRALGAIHTLLTSDDN
jgi:hypothetical protein